MLIFRFIFLYIIILLFFSYCRFLHHLTLCLKWSILAPFSLKATFRTEQAAVIGQLPQAQAGTAYRLKAVFPVFLIPSTSVFASRKTLFSCTFTMNITTITTSKTKNKQVTTAIYVYFPVTLYFIDFMH